MYNKIGMGMIEKKSTNWKVEKNSKRGGWRNEQLTCYSFERQAETNCKHAEHEGFTFKRGELSLDS